MVLVIAVGAATARAQPAEPPSAAAALFDEGRALLDAGKPQLACDKFEQALTLEPEGLGTILNLGLCNEQSDRLATALRWFRRVQARASELGKIDAEQAAKDKATALAQRVPTVKIVFTHVPPAGTVTAIDGATVAEFDRSRVEVDAGKHVVDVTLPNAPKVHEELELADGDAKTVTVQITPPAPPPVPKQFVTVDPGAAQRQRAYIIGGVGAALLAGDLALGLVARHYYNGTDELDSRDTWKSTVRYGGSAIFLVGAAAVAYGVTLYVRAPAAERVEVAPAAGKDSVGVTVFGTF